MKKTKPTHPSLPSRPYHFLELFAGAGGMALGLEQAGLYPIGLVEKNRDCCQTLHKNRPNWTLHAGDIADFSFKDIHTDIITGGFPCQPFSHAGKHQGLEDRRGNLFLHYVRAVAQIRPKCFLAENVKGLLTHDGGKTLTHIIQTFNGNGYQVFYKLLNARHFQVAQNRERLFLIGVDRTLSLKPHFPREQYHMTVLRDVLHEVPPSEGLTYKPFKYSIMMQIPQGGNWKNLPDTMRKHYMGINFKTDKGGSTGMARRLSLDQPAPTLTCHPAQKMTERCHPTQTRPLTIREYARIQSFPDEWQFCGSITSQYRQIGNAVPVRLATQLGKTLITMLDQQQKQ